MPERLKRLTIMPTVSPHGALHRFGALLLLSAIATTSPGLAAVPTKPLLTPQAIPLDEMVMAQRAYAANDPAEALARYLRVLDQNPRDLDALIGAGRAALDIGDPNVAVSFYARAEELSPQDGKIKAGLGSAMVQLVQPRAALRFFDDAVQLGVPVADIASDRGLAYALRGDNKRARADFDLALRRHADPETTRRLALTQAMDGDSAGAMATLDPLLRRQDKAAWRARVFALAIGGDIPTARKTANAMLPPQQADALSPFLDRIGKLRPSQQAAAVHFGQFPSDGRKYSEGELFAAAGSAPPPPPPIVPQPRVRQASASDMADDQGDGVPDRGGPDSPGGARKSEALAAKKPDIWAATDRSSFSLPATGPAKAAAPRLAMATPAASVTVAIPKPPEAAAIAATPAPAVSVAKPVETKKPAEKPVEKPLPAPKTETAAKDKKAEPAKTSSSASKSKQPERHWVQVAVGAYKPDLGKEWSKLKQKHPALLGKRSPWTTPLNRTNRLLIGPFKTADEAQSFVNKAAGSGFVTARFTSSPGQAVDPVK
jgi:Flp pilus assembly protein TadD